MAFRLKLRDPAPPISVDALRDREPIVEAEIYWRPINSRRHFAGMAHHDGAWEPGVYAKNAFNRKVELTRAVLVNRADI